MTSINGIDKSNLYALYASRTGMQPAQNVNTSTVNPSQVQKVDVDAVNKLAQKNAIAKTSGISETQKAGAASSGAVSTVQPQPTQEVAKVDAKTTIGVYGSNMSTPTASKYNAMNAGSAYAKTANSSSGYGIYDGLKNFNSGSVTKNDSVFSGVINNANASNNTTSGLSFGGLTNINPNQKIYDIA